MSQASLSKSLLVCGALSACAAFLQNRRIVSHFIVYVIIQGAASSVCKLTLLLS